MQNASKGTQRHHLGFRVWKGVRASQPEGPERNLVKISSHTREITLTANFRSEAQSLFSVFFFFFFTKKVFTADETRGVHCTISRYYPGWTHTPPVSSAAKTHTDQPSGAALTLRVLEGTKDFPLGCYPLDVWMVFKSQQPCLLFLFYLNHLKITRVVTGWIVSRYNSPVVDCTALQGAWNKWISSFGRKISIESHNVLWNHDHKKKKKTYKPILWHYTRLYLIQNFPGKRKHICHKTYSRKSSKQTSLKHPGWQFPELWVKMIWMNPTDHRTQHSKPDIWAIFQTPNVKRSLSMWQRNARKVSSRKEEFREVKALFFLES